MTRHHRRYQNLASPISGCAERSANEGQFLAVQEQDACRAKGDDDRQRK
jgi:hypothetical protein